MDRRVNNLLQMIDDLTRMSMETMQSSTLKKPPTPNTQRRLTKTNSIDRKEPSPARDIEQIGGMLNKLSTASDEIRHLQKTFNEDRERDRMRRNNSMRRAVSIENGVNDNDRPPIIRTSRTLMVQNGNLSRKCLSVDQSLMGQQRSKIWRNANESNSSIQSIDSEYEFGGGGGGGAGVNHARDSSLDSRLSGGSTQSDLPRHTRKKKRGIMGTLKQLTRSSSKANDTDGSVCNQKNSL